MYIPQFNVEGLTFQTGAPDALGEEDWRAIHAFNAAAFRDALGENRQGGRIRSDEEIDYLTDAHDFKGFYERMLDPQLAVKQGRVNEGQLYAEPVVAVARREDGMPVGYVYTAYNTSGNVAARRLKMHFAPLAAKKYVTIRSAAVSPEDGYMYRRRGLAPVLGYLALEERDNKVQPVSAFVWPREIVHVQEQLMGVGFESKAQSHNAHPFGDQNRAAEMYFMKAASIAKVLHRIKTLPGADAAIQQAHSHQLPNHRNLS